MSVLLGRDAWHDFLVHQAIVEPIGIIAAFRKAPNGGKLDPIDKNINRIISTVRAKVEHLYRVLKRQFGHLKTRSVGSLKTAPSSSRCLRSATCFWSDEGCLHEDEPVRKRKTAVVAVRK